MADRDNRSTPLLLLLVIVALVAIAWFLYDAREARLAADAAARVKAEADMRKAQFEKQMEQVRYDVEFKQFLEGRGPDPGRRP